MVWLASVGINEWTERVMRAGEQQQQLDGIVSGALFH